MITNSIALAGISFLYVFTLGSFFKLTVFPLLNRVTYYTVFESFVISRNVDHIILGCLLFVWIFFSINGTRKFVSIIVLVPVIYGAVTDNGLLLDAVALSSLPIAASFLIYGAIKRRNVLIRNSYLAPNYLAIIGSAIGIFAIIIPLMQIASVLDPPSRNYAFEMFVILALTSPALILLLIGCVPLKILIEFVKKRLKVVEDGIIPKSIINIKTTIILLGLCMALSSTIALIPHLPGINPDNQQVGVDTPFYVNWTTAMLEATSPQEVLTQAFIVINGGDRALSQLFIYAVAAAANTDTFDVIEYLPVLLGPLLVLAVFFLTRELTANDFTSIVAAFITALSYHALIGIYAGFYSNWFSLIIGYAAFTILLKYIKKPNKITFGLFVGLMFFLLFSHIYTWSIVAIAMGVFLGAMFKLNPHQRKVIIMASLVIASTVIVDVFRITLFGQTGGLERELAVAETQAGLDEFTARWNNLKYGTHTFLGGLFSNFIVLGLGLYWLYKANWKDLSSVFILAFLSVGLIPLLFGDWVIQTRVLYNIPFQIPAAIALTYIYRHAKGVMVILPVCIWLVWTALMAVTNFYIVLPPSPES